MFHAVAGKVLGSDDLKCTEKVQMFNGDSTRTKCANGAMYQNGRGNNYLVNSAQIIQTDIKFCTFLIYLSFALTVSFITLSVHCLFLSLYFQLYFSPPSLLSPL
jgi:hypothetical protein